MLPCRNRGRKHILAQEGQLNLKTLGNKRRRALPQMFSFQSVLGCRETNKELVAASQISLTRDHMERKDSQETDE
jgi:hypothetical protein